MRATFFAFCATCLAMSCRSVPNEDGDSQVANFSLDILNTPEGAPEWDEVRVILEAVPASDDMIIRSFKQSAFTTGTAEDIGLNVSYGSYTIDIEYFDASGAVIYRACQSERDLLREINEPHYKTKVKICLIDQFGNESRMFASTKLSPQEQAALKGARSSQLRSLTGSTPLKIDLQSIARNTKFPSFPSLIFAPKQGNDSQGHTFLMLVGHQIYQQALLASENKNFVHASNAAILLRKIIEVDLNFLNDPANPEQTNDNRFLLAAWFISNVARGALILDKSTPADWRQKENWPALKSKLNAWINSTPRSKADSRFKPMFALITDKGTKNWVNLQDSKAGATNRTFALLEAEMRVAELRLGSPSAQASLQAVFNTFRSYLPNYFTREEDCLGDPRLGPNPRLRCLKNKDEPRGDTFHPLMGLASIVHIVEIAKRNKLNLPAADTEKILKGLRWGADNNTARSGGFQEQDVNSGIDLWEVAQRLYTIEQLGPLVKRDRDRNRSMLHRAGLAWGYSLIAAGKY